MRGPGTWVPPEVGDEKPRAVRPEGGLRMGALLWRLALGVGIGAVSLGIAVRRMMADAGEAAGEAGTLSLLWDAVRQVSAVDLVVYVLLFSLMHVIRLYRWAVQLAAVGEPRVGLVMRAGAVGFAAIIVLPLRLGEFVRPWLVAQEGRASYGSAMGTAVVERVVDGLLVSVFLALGILLSPVEPSVVVQRSALAVLVLFVTASGVLVAAVQRPDWVDRVVVGTVERVSRRVAGRVRRFLVGFTAGARSLASGGVLWRYVGLTLLFWFVNALSLWWWVRAFDYGLSLWGAFVVLSVLVIGLTIPSGPGFFGTFQLFLGEGLRLASPGRVPGVTGLALALGLNVVQLAVQVAMGAPLWLRYVRPRRRRPPQAE